MNSYIITADIGGSHISSTIVDTRNWQIDAAKTVEAKVDAFSDKATIIHGWVNNLQQIAQVGELTKNLQIAIAIPGPFDYKNGVFQAHPEGKMGSLVGENFRNILLSSFGEEAKIVFENDAACFGLGAACFGRGESYEKVICVTLGTGIGSSFIAGQKIIRSGQAVPDGGEVYALPFLNGIADDHFSTRWFVGAIKQDLGMEVRGVRELVQTAPADYIQQIFTRFSTNFYQFLGPYARTFGAEAIIIGGNISKAWGHFSNQLTTLFEQDGIAVLQSQLNEQAIHFGAAKVFVDEYGVK